MHSKEYNIENDYTNALEKAINFLYSATAIATIAINLFDIFRLIDVPEMLVLYTNIPAIFIIFISLLLKNFNILSLKWSFTIIVSIILANSVISIYQSRLFEDLIVSMLREAIFISFLISLASFVVNQRLAYIISFVFCVSMVILYIITKDAYLLENLPVLIVIFFSYTIFINYLVKILYQMVDHLSMKNMVIKEQLEEIKAQNEELSELNEEMHLQQENLAHNNELLNINNYELTESKKQLNKLLETKDKLFSVIGHDIKNPLHVIIGYSKLLNQKYKELTDEKKRQFIDIIDKSVNSLFQLLEGLLAWSRAQQSNDIYQPEPTDLNNIISSSLSVFESTLNKKKLQVEFSTDAGLIAYADKNMVFLIIRNLLDNSIKYSSEGGTIWIDGEKTPSNIVIHITDNGIGIPENILENIFDINSEKTRPGTKGEKGSGFGLAICYEFAQRNMGKLWCESEEGIETKFSLQLPRKSISE